MKSLVKWDPWEEMSGLRTMLGRRFGDLLEYPFGRFGEFRPLHEEGEAWLPPVDIKETKTGYDIQAELPGLTKEDIELDVSRDSLTLQGERKVEKEEEAKERGYLRRERSYGQFQRMFRFDAEVNPDTVEASFESGVLKVKIMKVEQAKAKRVKVTIR